MSETIKELMELLIEYANGGMSGLYPPEDDIQELVDYILDLQEQLDETRKSELDKEYRISKAIEYMQNIHWFDLRNNEGLQLYGTTENFYNDLSNILKESDKE